MGRALRVEKPCGHCGSVMVLKPAIAKEQKFCSVSCGSRSKGSRRLKSIFCRGCHREFPRIVKSNRDAGLYCSRACYSQKKTKASIENAALRAIADHWKPVPNPVVVAEAEALRRIAARPVVARLTWALCAKGCGSMMYGYMGYTRTCRPCTIEGLRALRRASKKTEAGVRRRRVEKAMRKAKGMGLHVEKIDPLEVFSKDGWTCYLCGRDTPKHLVGVQVGNAPTVDHVTPLSRGGAHAWTNVRCACRQCNTRKSNT